MTLFFSFFDGDKTKKNKLCILNKIIIVQ